MTFAAQLTNVFAKARNANYAPTLMIPVEIVDIPAEMAVEFAGMDNAQRLVFLPQATVDRLDAAIAPCLAGFPADSLTVAAHKHDVQAHGIYATDSAGRKLSSSWSRRVAGGAVIKMGYML